MSAEITPEVVERLVGLARRIAERHRNYPSVGSEAKAIVALLPEPVDPDLLLARKAVFDVYMRGASGDNIFAGDVIGGQHDDAQVMHVALAAIKAARS